MNHRADIAFHAWLFGTGLVGSAAGITLGADLHLGPVAAQLVTGAGLLGGLVIGGLIGIAHGSRILTRRRKP